MNRLVIVESPNKITSISKYLGKEYKVMASIGHIADLPHSGKYGFGVDTETWIPTYKILSDKKKIVKELKETCQKFDEILIATDPDREGEAIASNLVDFLDIKDKYKRMRFNEITEEIIVKAIENLTFIDDSLVKSQIARRILDRVIGFQLSGLMRKKIKNSQASLSAGRVQSIALKLIIEKEKEIQKFIPITYFLANAQLDQKNEVIAQLFFPEQKNNKNWIEPQKIDEIKKNLKHEKELLVDKVSISQKNGNKVTPFKLSILLKRANSLFGYSSAKTQSCAQRLYEKGLISYPRTDSTRMSTAFVSKAQKIISQKWGKEYVAFEIKGFAGKQDAHEAIRPTDPNATPEMVSQKEKLASDVLKVYELIYLNTFKSLMKPPRNEILTYRLKAHQYFFKLSSSKVIFEGYYKLTGYEKNKELPKYAQGDSIPVYKFNFEEHQTKPPSRYSEGVLIESLENIGVGRPSTFTTTVNILKKRNYVELIEKKFKPTQLGEIVNDKLINSFPSIMNEKYTSDLENKLDDIADKKLDYKNLLSKFWENFQGEVIEATQTLDITKIEDRLAGKKCPNCGHDLVIKKNKKSGSEFYGCSDFPNCKYAEPILAGKKCPNCGSELVVKKNKYTNKEFYACPGFPNCKYIEPSKKTKKSKK